MPAGILTGRPALEGRLGGFFRFGASRLGGEYGGGFSGMVGLPQHLAPLAGPTEPPGEAEEVIGGYAQGPA